LEQNTERNTVSVRPCTCPHAFQDKEYGKGKRLHNIGGKSVTDRTYTCTVCGIVKK